MADRTREATPGQPAGGPVARLRDRRSIVAVAAVTLAVIVSLGSGASDSARAAAALPALAPAAGPALVSDVDQAQAVIDDTASTAAQVQAAGRFEQLATRALLAAISTTRAATLAKMNAVARAALTDDVDAASGLESIVTRQPSLPRWKILAPPPAATLLGYFMAAQARYGVPWEVLAGIEFVESKFGRVDGLSTAGAQGPMQFLPSTWAQYGTGSIDDPREAILAAARFLRANGAPGDIPGALYHYNQASVYVDAVEDYAREMTADPHAFLAYYGWSVIYALAGGSVILPIGYPSARPTPVEYPQV